MSGVQTAIDKWKKEHPPTPAPSPTPTPKPDPVPDPVPVPASAVCRGVMFVPATAGMPNNRGVSSQLDYRGCHGKPNENAIRMDMLQCVKNWGGNVVIYIRGEFCRPNDVLDMCLNGRKHPADGHYFPVNTPSGSGEVDWAMWAKEKYGINKHVCFIWNDNTSVCLLYTSPSPRD